MQLVKIDLGARSYNVVIGSNLFSACAKFLQDHNYPRKLFLVTDQTVEKLYAAEFIAELEKAGLEVLKFVTVPGEEAKSLSWLEKIYTTALAAQLDRKTPFLVLGGGVPGDLAGFAAATYMRGVPFIQIPTTLLAQVDSSVGGKVAVNHALGKNMIGAFYQPDAVFADIQTLKTLTSRDYASGLAEVVKYACLEGSEWLDFLENNLQLIKKRDGETLHELVKRCCQSKAEIVARDEKESSVRMQLNLGHTYGHAIEAAGKFSLYTHGEAVSIGLHGSLLLSEKLVGLKKQVRQRVLNLLQDFSLPIVASNLELKIAYEALWHDKKAVNGSLQWVLLEAPGKILVKKDIAPELVQEVLEKIVHN